MAWRRNHYDVVADNRVFIAELYSHLGIVMPPVTFDELVERFALARRFDGRGPVMRAPVHKERRLVPQATSAAELHGMLSEGRGPIGRQGETE